MQGIMETIFDVLYLGTAIFLGVRMLKASAKGSQFWLFGLMAVILGSGDAFHLVPRAAALLTDGLQNHVAALGAGKLITSITMTVFYLLLYQVWRVRYEIKGQKCVSYTLYALAAIRVALCLFPQNGWFSPDASTAWGIYRNIPFAIMGIIVIVLFFQSTKKAGDRAFRFMWLAVTLSFAFYIPVVLQPETFGILMIPKTIMYAWIVIMGYLDMKKGSKVR
ncbi:MAG: hypothetical protein RR893_12590 [Clostridia bacterium]